MNLPRTIVTSVVLGGLVAGVVPSQEIVLDSAFAQTESNTQTVSSRPLPGRFSVGVGDTTCDSGAGFGVGRGALVGGNGTDWNLSVGSRISSGSSGASCVALAEMRVTIPYTATEPTEGVLNFRYGVNSGIFGSTIFAEIDIGGKRIYWPPQTGPLDVPVVLTSDPLDVKVYIRGEASPTLRGNMLVNVDLHVPNGELTTSTGTPCLELAAAVMPDSPTSNTFLFQAENVPGSAHSCFVLGVSQQNLPVPPTFCPLLTNVLLAVPPTLETQETSELSFSLPDGPVQLHVQFLSATTVGGGEQWFTSNLVSVNL